MKNLLKTVQLWVIKYDQKTKSINNVMKKLYFSFLVFAITLAIIFFVKVPIAIFTGTIMAFFLIPIGQFFLQKFLDKKLSADNFTHFSRAVSIIFPEILWLLIIPFFATLDGCRKLTDETASKLFATLEVWTLFVGIFIFLFRAPILMKKLLALQETFKDRENNNS